MSTSARPPGGRAPSHGENATQRQAGGRAATSTRPPGERGTVAPPVLAEGECHVWSVELEQAAHVQAALAAHLSEDERRYMQALRLPALRSRYAVAHGALRVLLGHYLGVAPRLCSYATGPRGKPMLAGPYPEPRGGNASGPNRPLGSAPNAGARTQPDPASGTGPNLGSALHFNMAHSGTQALIAIAYGVEVGVDIELRRDMDDMAGVARSILSRADLDRWLALPEAQRLIAFYAIWTRKEAVSKAAGTGLYMDFPGLSVEFRPGRPAAVRRIDAAFGKPGEWLIAELDCAPGYSAALAARTPALRVSLHAAPIGDDTATDADIAADTA